MIAQRISVLFDAHNINKKAGGIEAYNRNLIDQLKKLPIHLHLYTNKLFQGGKDIYVPIADLGLYRILKGFRNALKKYNSQIIHCNNFLPYPAPKKVKKIVMVHDTCFLKEKNIISRPLYLFFFRQSLSAANRIITNSDSTKEQVKRFMKDKKGKKISAIHLGVDPSFKPIKSQKARAFVKKHYLIKSDFLLFPGNITKRKNLELAIKLAKHIQTKSYDLKIVITGVKPKKLKVIPNNIVFLNYVPQNHLNYLYNACSALIYPSICEGFALPIIEASRTKTPVICSPLPCIQEVAKNTVYYAKSENEWFNNLQDIVQDKYPKRLINRAYKNSLRYTWEKTAQKTLEVYKQLI